MSDEERREFQRLNLTTPIDGRFGKRAIRIRDVSAIGAQIESEKPFKIGARGRLRFSWRDVEVDIRSEVVRNADGVAGVHFLEESEPLRDLLVLSATELLRAQEANVSGHRELNVIAGDETLTAASAGVGAAGFLTFTLTENGWKKRKALLPDQPADGFTVSAGEAEDQIDLLRSTYENGDAETRKMTCLLAELSALSAIKR